MAEGIRTSFLPAKDVMKMVAACFLFWFVTSYWFTPAQGARQIFQFVEDSITTDHIDLLEADEDSNSSEDDDEKNAFDTFWPIVMMLITGIIFIIIVVIVCKRFCSNNGRPEWGPRNRSLSLEGVRNSQSTTAERESRDQPPVTDDSIWSVNITMDDTTPVPSHLKPPPYCDKPPSYDAIGSLDLPKYDTDNFDFGADDSLHELGESTSELNSSTSGYSSSSRGESSPRRYHLSTNSFPNEPPPVYQPPENTDSESGPCRTQTPPDSNGHGNILSVTSQERDSETRTEAL